MLNQAVLQFRETGAHFSVSVYPGYVSKVSKASFKIMSSDELN